MVRLSRGESQTRTRERLLAAAATVFARSGYGGASIDAISEAAGYSKGAFYSNFETKEAIFLELLARHMAGELTANDAMIAEAPTLEALIDRIADRYATDAEDQTWCLLSIEFALQAARSPEFARHYGALYERQYRGIAEVVSRLAALTGGAPVDPFAAAVEFVAFRQGLALDRSAPVPRLAAEATRQAFARFMCGLLGVTPEEAGRIAVRSG